MASARSARVGIRSIETAVPEVAIDQGAFRDLLASQPGLGRLGARLVGAAFDASGIDTRHTVVSAFDTRSAVVGGHSGDPEPFEVCDGVIGSPSTKERNDAYIAFAGPLAVEAARKALTATGDLDAGDVTHVITVSCTGFSAPGPDFAIVRELGLASSTQRLHVGFMGCYGAFPALRTAEQFCRADPDAVVLVVCVELCSLHLHVAPDADTVVAASVFADGAAAAVVTARRPAAETPAADLPVLQLDAFETMLVPEGEHDMAWSIGDRGFDMVLSSYVPRVVERHVREALAPLLAHDPGLGVGDVEGWAIHPGGRSILDRVQGELGLDATQLRPSREVLRDYGNMSSATVLFVLRRLLLGEAGSAAGTDAGSAAKAEAGAQAEAGAGAQQTADASARVLERELVGAVSGSGTTLVAPPPPAAARRTADGSSQQQRVVAMAFGPGLTVETALMTRRGAVVTGVDEAADSLRSDTPRSDSLRSGTE